MTARLSYRDWLHKAETEPTPFVPPKPPQPRTVIWMRCIPAVYIRHPVHVATGEPLGEIALNTSRLRFPNPRKPNGHFTDACREWITEAVAEAIRREGIQRLIVWSDLTFTTFNKDAEPTLRRPFGSHEDRHG
jgi:hypothetical protein